jgi:hypothetical protein
MEKNMKKILIILAVALISCSKEKQHKTYEFTGSLYQSGKGNKPASGKLRMDGTGYGEISFNGASGIQVQAVSTPKDNHINFVPQAKYNRGGYIKKNGEVYFTNDVMNFQGKLN